MDKSQAEQVAEQLRKAFPDRSISVGKSGMSDGTYVVELDPCTDSDAPLCYVVLASWLDRTVGNIWNAMG